MKIYIDSEYKCHTANDGTMREIEDKFFDGKCDELVEAYRHIPVGESWTDSNGEVFHGCMTAPWTDISDALGVQHTYELAQLAKLTEEAKTAVSLSEMDEAYREGVNSV